MDFRRGFSHRDTDTESSAPPSRTPSLMESYEAHFQRRQQQHQQPQQQRKKNHQQKRRSAASSTSTQQFLPLFGSDTSSNVVSDTNGEFGRKTGVPLHFLSAMRDVNWGSDDADGDDNASTTDDEDVITGPRRFLPSFNAQWNANNNGVYRHEDANDVPLQLMPRFTDADGNVNNNCGAHANANFNAGGGGGGPVLYSSTGVEGRSPSSRPGEGECSVMVAAQNLMANYIPVFNPKGAIVDMYGPPHGPLEQGQYAEKVKGWSDAVEMRLGRGGVGGGREGGGGGGRGGGGGGGNSGNNWNLNNAAKGQIGARGRNPARSEREQVETEKPHGWKALAASVAASDGGKGRRKGRRGASMSRKGANDNKNSTAMGIFQRAKGGNSAFRSPCNVARSFFGLNNNQTSFDAAAAADATSASAGADPSVEEAATNAQYQDDLGDCLDFIDDEYQVSRECAKAYHKSLCRVFETLKSNLQPGAPLGSRWNAFKNAFKAGKIAQCPELKLAKEFEAYEQVLINPGSPLHMAVQHMNQCFGLRCASKEALEHDIKTKFQKALFAFLDKEWKDVVAHDKAVQNLAIKIQKAKAEGRDQAVVAEMMELFKHERGKTIYLFNYILTSDYGQILKFINLTDCYIDHHRENLELMENVKKMLKHRANAAKPDLAVSVRPPPLGPDGGITGCLGTCSDPCAPAPGLVTDTKADNKEVDAEIQRIFGNKTSGRPADCGQHGFGQTCKPDEPEDIENALLESKSSCGGDAGGAAFLQYMEKRIKTRPYGFVKENYVAVKGGEMSLQIGEMVYLKGKPGFDKYCGEKEDGSTGVFPQKVLDVIIDVC